RVFAGRQGTRRQTASRSWSALGFPACANTRLKITGRSNEADTTSFILLPSLSQNRLDHIAMHIRQTIIAPAVAERQFRVVESDQMQDRSVEIVDVAFVLRHFHAVIVGLTVNNYAFDAAAAQPPPPRLAQM